jgi:thiol-disulfide isomerase/thioredoxin
LDLCTFASHIFTIRTSAGSTQRLAEQVKAPEFVEKDQTGATIYNGPHKKDSVVLVFYRGQWCPYCNKQLKRLEDSLPMIKAKGATFRLFGEFVFQAGILVLDFAEEGSGEIDDLINQRR